MLLGRGLSFLRRHRTYIFISFACVISVHQLSKQFKPIVTNYNFIKQTESPENTSSLVTTMVWSTLPPLNPPTIFEEVINPKSVMCHAELKFLVVVHCRMNAFKIRELWRNLYGQFKKKYDFDIMFAIGRNKNSTYQKLVEDEAKMHGDIQQADFIDSYQNLTHKHLSWMRYVDKHCHATPYILRMDDFVAWNVHYAAEYIANATLYDQEGIVCRMMKNRTVSRGPGSKWPVSKREYPNEYYPNYCLGGTGHIMAQKDISRILALSYITPFVWIDDAYVTGILRQLANVMILENNMFVGQYRRYNSTYGALSQMSSLKYFEACFYSANFPPPVTTQPLLSSTKTQKVTVKL